MAVATQMAATIDAGTSDPLPNGWRRTLAPDGRVYYQNDVTKETQWNRPTNPVDSVSTTNTPVQIIGQSTDNKKQEFIPKLRDPRNIIFVITCIVTIWDVYTDWYAGIAWMNVDYQQCESKFKCVYPKGGYARPLGICFIVFAILGFFAAACGKYKECKRLVYIHKHCKTHEELQEMEAECFQSALRWDMVSFLVEDTTAIIMVTLGALYFGDNDASISRAMQQSAVTSVLVMIAVFANTWRKRLMFSSYLKLSDKICHCACWCCCFCIVIVLGLVSLVTILITSQDSITEPFVSLNADPHQSCHLAFPDEDDYFEDGEIAGFPQYVFENCSGDEYVYDVVCNLTGVHNEYVDDDLQCRMSFYYDIMDTSSSYAMECDNRHYDNGTLNYFCDFNIVKETCNETYTIECNNDVAFYMGKATMFACFDYCSFG